MGFWTHVKKSIHHNTSSIINCQDYCYHSKGHVSTNRNIYCRNKKRKHMEDIRSIHRSFPFANPFPASSPDVVQKPPQEDSQPAASLDCTRNAPGVELRWKTSDWRYHMDVSKIVVPQIIHFNRVFHYNHPLWGTTIFGNIHMYCIWYNQDYNLWYVCYIYVVIIYRKIIYYVYISIYTYGYDDSKLNII